MSQYTADPASTIIKDTGQLIVLFAGFLWGEEFTVTGLSDKLLVSFRIHGTSWFEMKNNVIIFSELNKIIAGGAEESTALQDVSTKHQILL